MSNDERFLDRFTVMQKGLVANGFKRYDGDERHEYYRKDGSILKFRLTKRNGALMMLRDDGQWRSAPYQVQLNFQLKGQS
jgi:hypothetical protein